MKRFSLRELALVSSPLLVVAVVGWLLSKRKPPAPPLPVTPLHLTFHIEQPTVLEAFAGSNVALVVELAGKNADKMRVYSANLDLELNNVLKGSVNNTRFLLNSKGIPAGQLSLNVNAKVIPSAGGATTLPLSGTWKINRAQIKPFAFNLLKKPPEIVLRSVTITKTLSPKNPSLEGTMVFALTGSSVGIKTPVVFSLANSDGGMGWSTGASSDTATLRSIDWTASSAFWRPNKKQSVRVSGHASANNQWPLAFQTEPFDLAKVKVGQKLKFKSWPAPVPIS